MNRCRVCGWSARLDSPYCSRACETEDQQLVTRERAASSQWQLVREHHRLLGVPAWY